MCRLIALPPGTSPDVAHELVTNFVRGNDDGVGEAYVVKGEFKINKYPYSYNEAVTKKDKLFSHMPHDGWTIAHVRLATHGEHTWANTHPFIKGDTAVVHNGTFGMHSLIKAALGTGVKWSGDCDSEVAAYLFNKLGPEEFYKKMYQHYSVYLGLKRDGSLAAVKLGHGDLKVWRTEQDTFILASEFPWRLPYWDSKETEEGVLKLDKEGHASNFKFEKKQESKRSYYHQDTVTKGLTNGKSGQGTTATSCTPCGVSKNFNQPTHLEEGDIHRPDMVKQVGRPKTPKVLSLWDWPTEDEIQNFEELT